MAKVFANVCFCDILNAVHRFARDGRHFALCVQFLDLCLKWKKRQSFEKCVLAAAKKRTA